MARLDHMVLTVFRLRLLASRFQIPRRASMIEFAA
jgi:hypothetical protein